MALETKPFRNLPQLPNGTSVANNIKLTDCLPFQHTDINEGVNSFNKITMGQILCEPVATAGAISGNTYSATCSNFPDFAISYTDEQQKSHYYIGMKVRVVFNNGITYGSVSGGTYPKLNINNSGAIPLLAQGKTMASGACSSGQSLEFTLIPYDNGVAWDADSNVRESTSDYTIYTDGLITYTANYINSINANKLNSKKIQLQIGATYSFIVDGYYLSFQCYGSAAGQDRMGGVAIGEGGNYSWYNAINAGLLPSVSGVYDSSSGRTTVTITNNASYEQILDISYIA